MIPGRQRSATCCRGMRGNWPNTACKVRLDTTVDAAMLEKARADVVFVATGSVPQVPQNMLDGVAHSENINMLMIDDLLEQNIEPGEISGSRR